MWISAELLALTAVAWLMLWRLDDWREWALCAEVDPDAFFPEKGASTRAAKAICRRCLVKVECLRAALTNDERFGVWGGLSDRERRRLRGKASGTEATRADSTEPWCEP
jgi:WhiB family transcriptional regulator, redox-sensing transcriptional regulator